MGQANVYNGLDERVGVTSGSLVRSYVYDPDGRLLGEYDASTGAPIAETIWLSPEVANDNQPFGGDDGVGGEVYPELAEWAPLAVATGSGASVALYWVHGNHMGVPIVTTNASGAAATPPAYSMAGFPGQTKTLSDIYYNRYRDYDSSLGRYIQADPIGLSGGSNVYLYAGANPIRYLDPIGLAKIILFDPNSPKDQGFYRAALREPNKKGICAVFGHMSPGGIAKSDGTPLYTLSDIHALLMTKCSPDEPVFFLGCNAGFGNNSIAERYAHRYGVPTIGATAPVWWGPADKPGFRGIWHYNDSGGPDLNNPGTYKAFIP